MPILARRSHTDRPDCWHVYYGVQVGTMAVQPGLPTHAEQWRWDCGFYPASHRRSRTGYAAIFEQARANFEGCLERLPLGCTGTDFIEPPRQRAFTVWKYAMHDAGLPLPTQT